jgi:hypothetical protein
MNLRLTVWYNNPSPYILKKIIILDLEGEKGYGAASAGDPPSLTLSGTDASSCATLEMNAILSGLTTSSSYLIE